MTIHEIVCKKPLSLRVIEKNHIGYKAVLTVQYGKGKDSHTDEIEIYRRHGEKEWRRYDDGGVILDFAGFVDKEIFKLEFHGFISVNEFTEN